MKVFILELFALFCIEDKSTNIHRCISILYVYFKAYIFARALKSRKRECFVLSLEIGNDVVTHIT
jgi:hypothetical protein